MSGSITGLRKLAGLVTDMHSRQFDLAIDLQGLLRSGAIAVASGAPWRISFSNAREGASLSIRNMLIVPLHRNMPSADI